MKKLNNSNFELIQDIIKTIDLGYNESLQKNKEGLEVILSEVVGDKFSEISQVYDITERGILIIACADSFIANELYLKKDTLLTKMNDKAEKLGIKIKDIKFDYKIWKDKNNEK